LVARSAFLPGFFPKSQKVIFFRIIKQFMSSSIQKSFKPLTRGIYDDCAYQRRLHESTSPLLYQIAPYAYESCQKCHQGYPGFIGSMGGAAGGFGIGPDRIDIDSDIRGQTRLYTRCPTHKYNPHSYSYCGSCQNCNLGLPCGCNHCKTRDVSGLGDCRPGIIPIESLDTRTFNACNDLNSVYIDRFDYMCTNPQDPNKIFFYPGNRRLGDNTQLDFKDYSTQCINARLPDKMPCGTGQLGCRYLKDFNLNIY